MADIKMARMTARKKENAFMILLVVVSALFAASALSSTTYAQTTQRCRGNEICEVSIQGGQLVYDNCQPCGTNIVSCPNDVRPIVVDRVCKNVGVAGAQCQDGQAKCSGTGLADPNKVLKFTVYIPRSLIVTAVPVMRANIAGRTSDYKITIESKNPVALDLVIGAEAEQGWKTEFPATLQLGAKSKKDFTLKVTSPPGTQDSDQSILVTVFGFQSDDNNVVFNGQKTVTYQVASRAAASLTIEPTTQTGIRGEKLAYNVLMTNNDPKDFDASTVALSARVPEKWKADFASRSVRIRPGESATVKLDVTSAENAKQGPYDIDVNATVNGLENYAKAQYIVTTCGDGVCGLGEQCAVDCPLETWFSCNGRCEQQTDVGVDFSAQVKFPFTNFVICSRNSTTEQCKSAFNANSCGIGKSCLCGNRFDPACGMRCVDNDGAYYLSAGELGSAQIKRSNANYSFECPFVNLDEIKGMRNDFNSARQDFEKSRSGLKEQLNTATREQKEKLLPCYDGLGEIITVLKDHVKYLDEVIKFPAVSNTTEARAKSADVRASVDATYNSFCRGATGALQIVSLDAGNVEKGKNARASIVVKNAGNVNYYGYVACDFTSPQGKKNTTNTTCTPMSFGREYTFNPEAKADVEGTWKVQCKTIGSLRADCSSEVHDQSGIVAFDVFSRDTFVRDVSGTCTSEGASCTVRLSNNFACAGCRIENNECTKRSQTNDTTVFSCPRGIPGKYNLTGYVIPTSQCNPVPPQNKTVTVQCEGCGDETVQKPAEQCELPGTDNNQLCGQSEITFIDGRRGVRDRYGFCTPQCQCSADEFSFACVAGVGGATCSDGETRVVNKTVNGQQVTCTEQCGPTCTFENCTAEVPRGCTQNADCPSGQICSSGTCITPAATGLSVRVSHSPPNPTIQQEVALTATSNGVKTEIFVDGLRKISCASSPCIYSQMFAAGQHQYFAVAEDVSGTRIADPIEGTKIFTVSTPAITATGNITGNATTNITNSTITAGGQNITISISHSPANPTVDDNMTFTAAANITVERIEIFVDNFMKQTCNATAICAFSQKLASGLHEYYALFTRNNTTGRTPVGEVFVSSPSLAGIQSVDVPENVIFGSNAAIDFQLNNPGTAKFGQLLCTIRTPTQVRLANSQCFSLPQLQSTQSLLFIANELGAWNVSSCELNVSTRSDCFSSQQNDLKRNLGVFSVIQPSDIFITNVRSPQSVVVSANSSINVTVQNPTASSRFVRASCLLKTPTGSDITLQSTCSGVSLNTSRIFEIGFQPNQLGVWTLVSCSSDSSQAADCSNANRTQTLALARAINAIKSDKLDIVSASLSANNITIGESVSASVGVRNPTEIDRFSQVFCTFRTQNQANLINASACSLIRKDAQENIIATVKPPFIGRWNVTECKAMSSLNVDCAQSKEDGALQNIGIFDVNSATQPAGTGNVTGNATNQTQQCEILRFKPECVFGKSANRYTVSAEVSWEGGDHAHVIIGDDSGVKYTDKTFVASKVTGTPGKINVKPVVHDSGDNVICSKPVQEVFCLAGNVTTTELVQVIRNMKDAAPPGPVQVELYIGPLENVADFTLTEHADQSLPISNVVISGNQTLVFASNRTVTSTELDKPYNALIFNTALKKAQNITIAYTVTAQQEGDYKFFHIANASGEVMRGPFFNLFITTCPQIKRTLAVGPGGSCQSFRTSCDVPPGWKIEEKCPEIVTPPTDAGDGTLAIVVVVIIIVIVVIGYKKRDAIKERLAGLRGRLRREKGGEELPSDFGFR